MNRLSNSKESVSHILHQSPLNHKAGTATQKPTEFLLDITGMCTYEIVGLSAMHPQPTFIVSIRRSLLFQLLKLGKLLYKITTLAVKLS